MKHVLLFLVWMLFLNSVGVVHAHFTGSGHVHTLSESKQIFVNSRCRDTDSCDLKGFTLNRVAYEVWFADDPDRPTHGAGAIIEYETDSVAALEKYAVVQFKKGCVYYSSKQPDGSILRNVGDTVASFGENVPFCFPRWVIDSQDRDPVYNSDPDYGRFYLLRWNQNGSYDDLTRKFYGVEKPKRPAVYMTDYPAGAFLTRTGARNVALQFKTCIYRARDVPVQTHKDDLHFATPIACHEWESINIYDFELARFETQLAGVPWWEVAERRIISHWLVLGIGISGMVVLLILHLSRRSLARTRGGYS